MTSNPSIGNVSKPSFAKVAAMAPPTRVNQTPAKPQSDPTVISTTVDKRIPGQPPTLNFGELPYRRAGQAPVSGDEIAHLSHAVQSASIDERRDVAKGSKASPDWTPDPSSAEDQQSQVSHCSTKQSSMDGKSAVSAITFALDEKESIRPDDSASVQAVDEEGLLSGAATANSQAGVANGLSGRDEDATDTSPPASYPNTGSIPNAELGTAEPMHSSNAYPTSEVSSIAAAPDEKLLEAMSVLKDRLLLLNIEDKMLTFIQHSKESQLELPLQNSFARLLAHKLADYYNLLHVVGSDNNSVVLFRTTQQKLPPSISMIAGSLTTSTPLPTSSAAVTIMRRAGLSVGKLLTNSSTPISSSAPSKATSETGADTGSEEGMPSPTEGPVSRDKSKMSREEREAKYKSVRDRIFGDMPESSAADAPSTGETSAAISRSSSASGKKKSHKQRTPKDDSFQARSQVDWWPTAPFSSQQQPPNDTAPPPNYQQGPFTIPPIGNNYPITYGPGLTHTYVPNGFDPSNPFSNGSAYMSGPPAPQFEFREAWSGQPSSNNTVYYNYGPNNQNMPGASPQPPTMQPTGFNQLGQPLGTPISSPQPAWMQQPYQSPYPQPSTYPQTMPTTWSGVPGQLNTNPQFTYGQYPPQPTGNAQYPSPPLAHPSSFQASTFNPQTRAFVPASNARPNSRNVQPRPSLFRQLPSFSSSPQLGHSQNHSNTPSTLSGTPMSPSQEESIQKKWGTPSHLPKKPPPSEVPSAYDIDKNGSLPSQKPYPSIVAGGAKSNGPALVASSGSGF